MRKTTPYLLLVLFLFILDQITKWVIAQNIILHTSVSVIPGFFNLTHIRNKGAVFGFLAQTESPLVKNFLLLASLVALCVVIYYFLKIPSSQKFLKLSLSIILAGAMGNMVDRVGRGYVIDFLDFYVKKWHWPSFNVADSCVTVGAFLLIYLIFFRRGTGCILSS